MRSSYKKIGKYVKQVNNRNKDLSVVNLKGININKKFMPSVANTKGTDLSKYKVVFYKQFAFNPMHVGRDEVLPISMLDSDESVIVSPAYIVFEVGETELLSEYLMMWCRRSEFDRNAWFTTDSSVRGGFSWNDFCNMELPVPDLEKQREIVKEYNTIVNRIKLNEELNKKLEETAQSIYKHWFVDFEFPISKECSEEIKKPNLEGKPYKSSGGEMVYNEELDQEIPDGWDIDVLTGISDYLNGLAMQKFETDLDNYLPVIKIKELNQGYTDIKSGKASIDIPEDYIICNGDIIFSWSGTLTVDIWCGGIGGLNQHLFKVTSNKYKKWFIYLWTKFHLVNFKRIADGKKTSMGHIKRNDLNNAYVLIPMFYDLKYMNTTMTPIIDSIINAKLKIRQLSIVRELLLSKMAKG